MIENTKYEQWKFDTQEQQFSKAQDVLKNWEASLRRRRDMSRIRIEGGVLSCLFWLVICLAVGANGLAFDSLLPESLNMEGWNRDASGNVRAGFGGGYRTFQMRGLLFHLRDAAFHLVSRFSRFPSLPANEKQCRKTKNYQPPFGGCVPLWRVLVCAACIWGACLTVFFGRRRLYLLVAFGVGSIGTLVFFTGKADCHKQGHNCDLPNPRRLPAEVIAPTQAHLEAKSKLGHYRIEIVMRREHAPKEQS